ncbi:MULTISPECIES: TOBE domain-containing protein [Shewanella]|uniref:TOBE domain-containing protein n=1 Tax=Shewanella metallivivens TaxID=2872342 RepID=A0ABT5TIQ0_9GAMM|nr:TOBE domain-containing protein [Shewanella metallivivens]MDD8058476.1 TOBE domain-containing protein [Shewanella metallivivens]
MKISARNQLKGTVKSIEMGAVNSEVTIELSGGERIASIITNQAVKSLDLKVGSTTYAIVKASNVMLAVD